MECIIETGRPIPAHGKFGTAKTDRGPKLTAALEALELGQNLLWPETTFSGLNNVKANASKCSKRTGKKFTTRMTDDGVRCWRVV